MLSNLKNKSKQEIQQMLDDAWLGINVNEATLANMLDNVPIDLEEKPFLWYTFLLSQPEYFSCLCKEILNINLLPFQCVILKELWEHKFPMLIINRGGSKSFLLAVYAILRCLLIPGRKVIVCGSAFRQSKIIFEYIERIWANAPILRDIMGNGSGARHQPDRWIFHFRDSTVMALPIGTGETIRGLRANDVIHDEFAAGNVEIFETVIAGFAAVRAEPALNVQSEAKKKIERLLNILEAAKEDGVSSDNQIILAGTAYYSFNHFHDYWQRWRKIVLSRGKKSKLLELLNDTSIPKGFRYQDYAVIRIPYDMLPEGFMDEAQVSRSRATVDSARFQNEFGSCLNQDAKIITDSGVKNICDVNINDKVLTHNGRFRKVVQLHKKWYTGDIFKVKTYGSYNTFYITPEHPVYNGKSFILPENIDQGLYLPKLMELSNLKQIDITDYVNNVVDNNNYLHPRAGNNKITTPQVRDQIFKLKDSGKTYREIENILNIKYSSIWSCIKSRNLKQKNSVPKYVNLNYDFGVCLGYYASEGSIGGNGKRVEFALDGHVNTKLQYYISQLESSLYNTFELKTKNYFRDENLCNVGINSRILADLFKSLAPGDCYTKLVNHKILFSNTEFMRGFIIGMFNGDGHINSNLATITLTNESLINQIQLILTQFDIGCNLSIRPKKTSVINSIEHKCEQAYIINITGNNYIKFMNLFYNTNLSIKIAKRNSVYSNKNSMLYKLKNIELKKWDGFVYNLGVEEDNSYSLINGNVHNCFSKDSNGYFRRSLIESCVVNKAITIAGGREIFPFTASLYGNKEKKYVFGIDPASENDNLALSILELNGEHRKIIYSWTMNRKLHIKLVQEKLVKENDYFGYCARKIRTLLDRFPCEAIGIDSQGGGIALMEALHDLDKLKEGEQPIWPIIDPDKPRASDGEKGLHIIHPISFSSAEWVSKANTGLRKDLEDKVCLFPMFDAALLAVTTFEDQQTKLVFDTLEDCVMDIEELKDELSSIVMTSTGSGRERWDTPDKLTEGKKGTMRKDRYSALLIANAIARDILRIPQQEYKNFATGGFSGASTKQLENMDLMMGPAWLVEKYKGLYD